MPVLLLGVLAGVVVGVALPVILRRRSDPALRQRALGRVAFALLSGYAVVVAAFLIGEALDRPGWPAALMLILAWLVPLLVLAVLARALPRFATAVLAVLVGAIVGSLLLHPVAPALIALERRLGPLEAVALFLVAGACGVLGLRRPASAGVLLTTGGVLSVLASLGRSASLMAVAIVPVVAGATFLLAARLGRGEDVGAGTPGAPHPGNSVRPPSTRST